MKRFKDGLWPITVVTLATRPGSEEATRVWIDERWETWVRWSAEAGVSGEECESTTSDTAEATQVEDERTGRAAGGWMVGRAEAGERRDRRTTYPGKKDLMGFHQPKWERDRVMAGLCEEAGRMKQGGGRAILLTYSDASLKNGVATYAWMVGGLQGGAEWRGGRRLSGGGRVHGHPSRLSSTRAEHVGVLSALTSLAQWPELRHAFDGHVHYCDNKGVSDRMDHEEWQESSVFGFSDWARANDPDIHAEAEAQRSELGMATRVQWHTVNHAL